MSEFDFVGKSPGVILREIDESFIDSPTADDGLLIIGTAPQGPGMKPVKINNINSFVNIFGKPVSGKGTPNNDVFRDGNYQGPTYGMYAAQAWLASGTSPVTFIRLLGNDAPTGEQASNYVKAGWTLGGAGLNASPASNVTAYGLFIMPSASFGTWGSQPLGNNVGADAGATGNRNATGSLAAIIYCSGSSLGLSGTIAGTHPDHLGNLDADTGYLPQQTASAGAMIESINEGSAVPNTFKLAIFDADGQLSRGGGVVPSPSEVLTFHFDPDKKDGYIRNVLNTNPQKLFSTNYATEQNKKYFLGETFEESVKRLVTDVSGTAGQQIAMLLPLQSGSAVANNYVQHQAPASAAKTGWFINRRPNPTIDKSSYNSSQMQKLFRLVSKHEGEDFRKRYTVAICDIRLGTTENPNSSFSVKIMDTAGNYVEEFSNVNMDESSPNFIGKRIGTIDTTWDATNRTFQQTGDYNSKSNYVRVELSDDFNAGLTDTFAVPFGFFGPARLKGFTLFGTGSSIASTDADAGAGNIISPVRFGSQHTGSSNTEAFSFIKVGTGVTAQPLSPVANKQIVTTGQNFRNMTASFSFPRLKLTEQSTAPGSTNYKKNELLGVRHKFSSDTSSEIYTRQDYIDILRDLGGEMSIFKNNDSTATSETELSFVFTLDEVIQSNGQFYWESGSLAAGTSLTSISGSSAILDAKAKQFAAPFMGGFDGLDITHVNPFSNNNVLSGKSADDHYAFYSADKALDIIAKNDGDFALFYDVVSMPGITNNTLTDKLIDLVDNSDSGRKDALAIIDIDDGYLESYENNGTRTGGNVDTVIQAVDDRKLNSSYVASYYPRVRMRDTLRGNGDVFVCPSSVAGLGAIAYSDAVSEPWFAPAGFNRGGISILGGNAGPRVIGTHKNMTKADRDNLYAKNVNPIARFPAVGEIVIFGQKTMQQKRSALDRINVRRLMVFLKSRIGQVADTILFDANLEATWSRFRTGADRILSDVQSRFGIQEYRLVLDETTTTDTYVDQNIMYAKVFVKPAKAIEYIVVDFVITRSGVEF